MAKTNNTSAKNTKATGAKKKADAGGEAKPKRTRNKGLSFKDVQFLLAMDGIEEVRSQFESRKVSRPTLKRALAELLNQGRKGDNINQLAEFVSEVAPNGAGRGRLPPTPGETRVYTAQQVKVGGAFLRIPLVTMGVEKGGEVSVEFRRDGRIVLSPATAASGANKAAA